MMNERIQVLAKQALKHPDNDNDGLTVFDNDELEKFAKVLLLDCMANLEFHGHEDAISQLRWHAQSKYGIILD
jgi:hypothetical protein